MLAARAQRYGHASGGEPLGRWVAALLPVTPVLEVHDMATQCTHLDHVRDVAPRTPQGCEECLQMHARWVHLRLCLECGHVGCCDNSPNKHATKHFHATHHPIIRSFEPEEDWGWCYVDELFLQPAPTAP